MMVCGLFCVFWLSFGLLQLPTLGLATAYSVTGSASEGLVSKEMNAVIALYLLVWGFALGTFWLFTIRINAVFAGIFGFVTVGSWVLSGAYWALSVGKFDKALKLQKVRWNHSLTMIRMLTKTLGWWCASLRNGNAGLVHAVRDHGCGDALVCQFTGWRPVALLAEDGCRACDHGEREERVAVVARSRPHQRLYKVEHLADSISCLSLQGDRCRYNHATSDAIFQRTMRFSD